MRTPILYRSHHKQIFDARVWTRSTIDNGPALQRKIDYWSHAVLILKID